MTETQAGHRVGGTTGDPAAPAEGAHRFASSPDLAPIVLLEGLRARAVDGERVTMAVVEMAPGLAMPEHRHPNEQVGIIVRGEFTFTIGGETRIRRPGDMWVIPSDVPHSVLAAGPDGCTVVEVFSPPRADWADKPRDEAAPGRWP